MFGRNKQKNAVASNSTGQDSGAIIQGFVCPMCLLSFSSSTDLEVHFQLNHDKPKLEDDEMVLLRQQLAAGEQTRDLMQREISRHLDTIKSLEANISSLTTGRNDSELALQNTLTELSTLKQSLDQERHMHLEVLSLNDSLQRSLHEVREELGKRPDDGCVEELKFKCDSSEKLVLTLKRDFELAMAQHTAELAKLQENLSSVQRSYRGFMQSLTRLIADIERYETEDSESFDTVGSDDLTPESSSLITLFSKQLKKQVDEKKRLQKSLFDHQLLREDFLQNQIKLEERIKSLEKTHLQIRTKLLDLGKLQGIDGLGVDVDTDDITLLESVRRSFGALHEKNERLKLEIEHNVSDEDVLKRLKQDYETVIVEKEKEILLLQSDVNNEKSRMDDLKTHIAALEKDLAILSTEKLSLNATIEKNVQLFRRASEQLTGDSGCEFQDDEFCRCIDSAAKKIESLIVENRTLKETLEAKEELVSSNGKQVLELEGEVKAKSQLIADLAATADKLRQETANYTQACMTMEEENRSLKSSSEELQQAICSHLQTVDGLQREKEISTHKLQELSSQLESMSLHIEELRTSVDSKNSELAIASAKIEDSNSTISDLENRLSLAVSSSAESEKLISSLTLNVSTLENENQRLVAESLAVDKCLKSCQEQLGVKSDQISSQESLLSELRGTKDKLQKELDELHTEYESVKNSLSSEIVARELESSKACELEISVNKERLIVSELNAEIRLAREAYRNLEKTNSTLEKEKQEAVNELSSTRKLQEDLEQNNAKLKLDHLGEMMRLKNELDAKETFLRSQYGELESKLRSEMSGLITRLEQCQGENQDLDDELNDLQRRYKELQLGLQELGREQQNLQMQTHRIKEHRWVDDADVTCCSKCHQKFSMTIRRHHCRRCGLVFCNGCSSKSAVVGASSRKPVRVCDACYKDVQET